MFVFEVLKGVGLLATTIAFIFTGISFGTIPAINCVEMWEDNPKKFNMSYARGYGTASTIYFVIIIVLSAYNGFHDVFIIIVCFFSILFTIILLAMIETGYDFWSLILGFSGLPLLIKLSHTTYFVADLVLKGKTGSDEFSFMFTSFVFELLLILFYTLWPFLTFTADNFRGLPFTIWALEYGDMISHSIVLLSYANNIDGEFNANWKNNILNTYFAFFIINLYLWTGLLYGALFIVNVDHDKEVLAAHVLSVDILTDIPMIITTLVGRTYVGSVYISIDIAVKIVLFARAVWIAIAVFSDMFSIEEHMGYWDYSKQEIDDTSSAGYAGYDDFEED